MIYKKHSFPVSPDQTTPNESPDTHTTTKLRHEQDEFCPKYVPSNNVFNIATLGMYSDNSSSNRADLSSRSHVDVTYETAAKILFMTIKWARNIPSFLALPFRDQAILLEESWSELFILSAAQWSMSLDTSKLINISMYISRGESEKGLSASLLIYS